MINSPLGGWTPFPARRLNLLSAIAPTGGAGITAFQELRFNAPSQPETGDSAVCMK